MDGSRCNHLGLLAQRLLVLSTLLLGALNATVVAAEPTPDMAQQLASQVTIYRDAYGAPHIDGATDAATIFGFAYAQAEDNFWQIEDNYILGLGRYSEVHGPKGLNSDLLNHAYEITRRAREDYETKLTSEDKRLYEAFVAGLNYYLAKHPEVKPRLIKQFEPWQLMAFNRHALLELCFRYTRVHNNYTPRGNTMIYAATGSNAWAISGSKTKSGKPMLMVNPHLPWFGFAQMYEAHLRSGEGLHFIGATFYGNLLPTLGHNEHLGWAMTTNEPDIADVWRETFDDPQNPDNYRYGDGYRTAERWEATIGVKTASGVQQKKYTFRKTHHGPVVGKENDKQFLTARVAGQDSTLLLKQALRLTKAKNLSEFRAALGMAQFPFMNYIYADRENNILLVYNGAIPRRDTKFDWSKPVPGHDPQAEWKGMHTIEELPQVFNPPSGYVQNCNSSPFTTSDDGNPDRAKFPKYMVEDANDDKRRAKISRELLRKLHTVTLDDLERAAFDTKLYWAATELGAYARAWETLQTTDPALAKQVEPYLKHLLDWDYRITAESTQATLCTAWYEEMYGTEYPGEELLPYYRDNMTARFQALRNAASKLTNMHGDWRIAYGDIHRMQRHAKVADLLDLPFVDAQPSLPHLGGHGPMGVVFTAYYTPSIKIPFIKTIKNQYGVVGATYLAVYEFGEKIEGRSVMNFGAQGQPGAPHFMDQGELMSNCRMKPELFYWNDVLSGAKQQYRPGERRSSIAVGPTDTKLK